MIDSTIVDKDYYEFARPYEDAMISLKVRIEALNNDYRSKNQNYPIHNIQFRVKKLKSLLEKLENKKLTVSLDAAKECLTDIAGIRIICYFIEDVYVVENLLKKLPDIVIIKESDYIKNPKTNGYRSFHLVVGVPVCYSDTTEYYPVEIQLRTISMDFWASMEHRICYKQDMRNNKEISKKLLDYAQQLLVIEKEMSANLLLII